jgi:hypothetical protein
MWNKDKIIQILDAKIPEEAISINKITLGDPNGHFYISWSEIDEHGHPVTVEECIHPNWKPTVIMSRAKDN